MINALMSFLLLMTVACGESNFNSGMGSAQNRPEAEDVIADPQVDPEINPEPAELLFGLIEPGTYEGTFSGVVQAKYHLNFDDLLGNHIADQWSCHARLEKIEQSGNEVSFRVYNIRAGTNNRCTTDNCMTRLTVISTTEIKLENKCSDMPNALIGTLRLQ